MNADFTLLFGVVKRPEFPKGMMEFTVTRLHHIDHDIRLATRCFLDHFNKLPEEVVLILARLLNDLDPSNVSWVQHCLDRQRCTSPRVMKDLAPFLEHSDLQIATWTARRLRYPEAALSEARLLIAIRLLNVLYRLAPYENREYRFIVGYDHSIPESVFQQLVADLADPNVGTAFRTMGFLKERDLPFPTLESVSRHLRDSRHEVQLLALHVFEDGESLPQACLSAIREKMKYADVNQIMKQYAW